LIRRIGHLAFHVRDMEATLRFYCDILGFRKAFELHRDNGEPWIVYVKVNDGQFIEFFYGGENAVPPVEKPVGYNHFCLEVEDIEQVARHLKENGVKLDVEPKRGKDLNLQCWAKDPDGNRIEFMQMNPDSPQMKS